jgi:hypothetical protein
MNFAWLPEKKDCFRKQMIFDNANAMCFIGDIKQMFKYYFEDLTNKQTNKQTNKHTNKLNPWFRVFLEEIVVA